LADIPALTAILTYHVAAGKVMSTDLSNNMMVTTLNGKKAKITITADGAFINGAKITVKDIAADNGVVHVIDAVLLPPAKAAFPIDFEAVTDAEWTVFENGTGTDTDFMIISNPDKSGINTSEKVLQFKVNTNAAVYAGAFSNSYGPVSFTQPSHTITMMVWKSVISPVGFKVEGSTNGGPVSELKIPNTLTNQWEMITFDFSSLIGFSYDRIVIFPDFPATRTSGTTVYIDNIVKSGATGISSKNVSGVKVYPNPVVDILKVSFTTPNAKVAIFNSVGHIMESFIAEGTETTIDVSSYSRGLYFVKVNDDSVVKFVK